MSSYVSSSSKDNDSYTVEIKGYGMHPRSGKVVFYNSETLEVYGEESFSGLKLGSTTTFDFGKLGAPLRDKCPNLGVRVLEGEEVVDGDQPAEKYRPLKTLPEWYYKYWDVEELNNPDEDTPADPTPSPEPTPAPTQNPAPATPEPTTEPAQTPAAPTQTPEQTPAPTAPPAQGEQPAPPADQGTGSEGGN